RAMRPSITSSTPGLRRTRSTWTPFRPCARTGPETAATCATATWHEFTRTAGVLLDDLRRRRTAHRPGVQPVQLARSRRVGRARRIHRPGHLAFGPGASAQQAFSAGDEADPAGPRHQAPGAR